MPHINLFVQPTDVADAERIAPLMLPEFPGLISAANVLSAACGEGMVIQRKLWLRVHYPTSMINVLRRRRQLGRRPLSYADRRLEEQRQSALQWLRTNAAGGWLVDNVLAKRP